MLFSFKENHYSLIVKVEKINRSQGLKIMYYYFQLKNDKILGLEAVCMK